jgi:hypothetical protein
MTEFNIALAVFTVWGIVDYFNVRLAFDEFFVMEKPKGKNYNYIWLIYYFLITYLFCISKYMNISVLVIITYCLYYLRIVPFLWSQYGIRVKIPVVVLFYEEIESILSSNIAVLIWKVSGKYKNEFLIEDFCTALVAVFFLVLFALLLYFRRNRVLNIWFANLTVKEYIHFIIIIYILGNIEIAICLNPEYRILMRILVVILTFLIIILIARIIIVYEHNYSMGNVIGILEEQIKKMTGYYNELNKKEMQLKQFRHDVKNLLIALHSMITEGKVEQALQYIEKMQTMYQHTTNSYDTGNFIADALINSKAPAAEQINTKIEMNGFIPAEKIDDVDMVILLSNMLDNALEACEKIEGEKRIVIDSALNKQMWILTVKNPVNKNLSIKKNYLPTSKGNKEIHGYGLLNMERVVKHYDGMLKLQCENNEFVARATLMINQ